MDGADAGGATVKIVANRDVDGAGARDGTVKIVTNRDVDGGVGTI